MISVTALNQAMLDFLAGSASWFNDNPNVVLRLAKAPFTPSPTLTWAQFDDILADFDGYTDKVCGSPAVTGLDPVSGLYQLWAPPPAGGFRWETTGTTNLPETIYGFALGNSDSSTLYASALFDTPVVLTDVNQVVEVLSATLSLRNNPIL